MKLCKIILYSIIFLGCSIGAGTLGSFEPITFPTSKKRIEQAIDSLFSNYPEYHIPKKWQYLDNWKNRGYSFLQGNIFYLSNAPEEMYYVTYVGDEEMLTDSTKIQLAIRAINNGKNRWLLNDDLNQNEKTRIIKRFNSEIVSKLEYYSKVKVRK